MDEYRIVGKEDLLFKPCPFCGGDPSFFCRDTPNGMLWWIECVDPCGCKMGSEMDGFESEYDAAINWNIRTINGITYDD